MRNVCNRVPLFDLHVGAGEGFRHGTGHVLRAVVSTGFRIGLQIFKQALVRRLLRHSPFGLDCRDGSLRNECIGGDDPGEISIAHYLHSGQLLRRACVD